MSDENSVAASILMEGAGIVDGVRSKTHGARERSFRMTAAMWSAYLEHPVSAEDVAWMMGNLKQARSKCGEKVRDHYVDGSSYPALAGELALGADG